jgi:mono/diheme cytochrome c family protein
MRRAAFALAVLALLAGAAFWLLTSPALTRGGALALPAGEADLANGEVMFNAGGCVSCHAAPGQDDRLNLAGGLALSSPYGTFNIPNISPHPDGIGGWSLVDFVRAMREGVSPQGLHYYPSFPYTSYQRMRVEDLRDLFAYIMSLEPVAGVGRGHDLAFPYNLRRGIGLWKLVYLDGEEFAPDPARSESWNRGAYLVEGPSHCAECHSTRNFAGAIVPEYRHAGGPDPEGGRGFVPNITPHPDGIGDWVVEDMAELLMSGFTPDFDSVGGTMAAVVRNTERLPQADIEAMAEYVMSLPPRPTPPRR